MGQMRFFAPQAERISDGAAKRAYIAGSEGVPWECRVEYDAGLLSISRDARESGQLYFPWNVLGYGELMLSTASLMERVRPYHLPVELARGSINKLRNQSYVWQQAGMTLPPKFAPLLREASTIFARAATSQHDDAAAANWAEQAICLAVEASELLVTNYAAQVLAIRRTNGAALSTLIVGRLDEVPTPPHDAQFAAAFNMAAICPIWKEVEPVSGERDFSKIDAALVWARERGQRLMVGPLLTFAPKHLPDWLYLWEDEFEELQQFLRSHIEAVVQRYKGKVHLWHVAAGMNVNQSLELDEEQRLKLTVDAIELVRAIDPRTPVFVSFDQPWGEYIAGEDQELTPLNFADTLIRGELGLSGVGIDINFGYWPGGSMLRDPLELSRMIDRWTHLQVPLVVSLAIPSSTAGDIGARHASKPLSTMSAAGLSPAWQKQQLEKILPLLASKQTVQAIVWNQWTDQHAHELPHAGLIDTTGKEKPALEYFKTFRRDTIGS